LSSAAKSFVQLVDWPSDKIEAKSPGRNETRTKLQLEIEKFLSHLCSIIHLKKQ
jgi:hypothetical protein